MGALTIICIIWILLISWIEIRKNKKRGVYFIAFILVCAVLASFSNRLGFDGEIVALIFAVIVGVIYFIKTRETRN